MFPTSKVVHLECGSLDHKPLMIFPAGMPKRLTNHRGLNKCGWRMEDVGRWKRHGHMNFRVVPLIDWKGKLIGVVGN